MRESKSSRFILASVFAVASAFAFSAFAEESPPAGNFQLHGFMDVGYYQSTNGQPNQSYDRGFRTNGLDLYFSPDFGDRVRAIAEVNIDPDIAAQGTSVGIDYERMQLGYVFSQYLTAWIGRFHTPMGAYIIQSHHGAMLQTALNKPKFIDFEDKYGVMPVHSTGLWLTGNVLINEDRFNYQVYTSNGSSIDDSAGRLDMNVLHAQSKRATMGGRLTYFFVNGLQLGASYLNGDVNHFSSDPTVSVSKVGSSRLNIYAAHLVYDTQGFEFMNEAYGFRNTIADQNNAPTYGSFAGFSQLAYTVEEYVPYFRYERGNFNANDPYFNSQINGAPYKRFALGLRYNLSERAAVKGEVLRTSFDRSVGQLTQGGYNSVAFQYAISF